MDPLLTVLWDVDPEPDCHESCPLVLFPNGVVDWGLYVLIEEPPEVILEFPGIGDEEEELRIVTGLPLRYLSQDVVELRQILEFDYPRAKEKEQGC